MRKSCTLSTSLQSSCRGNQNHFFHLWHHHNQANVYGINGLIYIVWTYGLIYRDAQQLCPVHGLLGTGTASRPAPQRPSSEGCWAEGRWAGLRGALSPPCHSATTRQRSSHNASGQDKGGVLPCPTASLPGFATRTDRAWGQPEDIREELLEELVELLGGGWGRKTWGWTRRLQVLYCNSSSQWGHIQSWSDGWKSCFSLWGTDASSSGDEKNHHHLEVPEALRLFQLDSSGKTKGMHSWPLKSTEELTVLIPCGARGSSCKK